MPLISRRGSPGGSRSFGMYPRTTNPTIVIAYQLAQSSSKKSTSVHFRFFPGPSKPSGAVSCGAVARVTLVT